jgi:autotransporter-associated beta strand protein
MLTTWFQRQRLFSTSSPRRQPGGLRSSVFFRPDLETLETRVVPATRTWTGLGANDLWTTGANWQGAVAPSPNDDLVFPAGAQRLTNTDNFSAGTAFNSLTYSGTGYFVTTNSNSLNLGPGGINNSATSGLNDYLGPVALGAVRTITVASGGTFEIDGIVSGAGGITKAGVGTLNLGNGGSPNTYSGGTTVNGGVLNLGVNSGLGTGAVTVSAGGELDLGGGLTVSNPLTLNGTGVANAGALHNTSGTDTWTGSVTLNSSTTIGVDLSTLLTIQGLISGPTSAGLTTTTSSAFGAGGTLVFTANNTYSGPTTVGAGILEIDGSQPSSPVTVNGSVSVLSGTGTIGTLITTFGAVFPGRINAGFPTPGILTVNGDVTPGVGSFFDCYLNDRAPGQFSQLKVIGNHLVFLNSPFLARQENVTTPVGYQFPIIDATATGHTIGGHFVDSAGNPIGQDGLFSLSDPIINPQAFFTHYDNSVTLIRAQGPMAPELAVSPGEINEGDTVTLNGRLFDPVDPSTLTLTVDWGDGTPLETYTPGQVPFSIQHTYAQTPPGQAHGGSFTITAHWFDALDMGNSRQLFVIVNNVPPTVFAGNDITLNTGDTLERDGYCSDPGTETWTAMVDYGDGAGWQPLDLNPDMSFHLEHTYSTAGQYQVQVMVTDSDNEFGIGSFTVTVMGG